MKIKSAIWFHPATRLFCAASVIAALSGCAQNDFSPSGSNWHENNFVAQDIAAQLSDPADIIHGHGETTVPAQAFVAAATSWSTGQSASSGTPSSALVGNAAGVAGTP